MTVKVDKFGRFVIPKPIRDQLDLAKGTELELEVQGRTILLTPVKDKPYMTERGGVLVFTGEVIGPPEGILEGLHWKRLESLAGA